MKRFFKTDRPVINELSELKSAISVPELPCKYYAILRRRVDSSEMSLVVVRNRDRYTRDSLTALYNSIRWIVIDVISLNSFETDV